MQRSPAVLLISVVVVSCAGAVVGEHSDDKPTVRVSRATTGIAPTPHNFPLHTAEDVEDAFNLTTKLGDHAVFIYQWSALDLELARLMVTKSNRIGLTPILAVSPTKLAGGRSELDLPDEVRRRAGPMVSFANPVIRDAFKSAVRELASLEPAYLCLATEINLLAIHRLDEFLHFASLYKEAYREAKSISPETKVFVSFQWEWMRIVDAQEPHKIEEHSKVIDVFRPELDLVALTTYPSPFHDSPADLPRDYYSWSRHHVRRQDEILLMEVGWPTGASGSESEQVKFIRRLSNLLQTVNVSVIAWALLHDVSIEVFDEDLETVGLLTNDGVAKPGFDEFTKLYESLQSSARLQAKGSRAADAESS